MQALNIKQGTCRRTAQINQAINASLIYQRISCCEPESSIEESSRLTEKRTARMRNRGQAKGKGQGRGRGQGRGQEHQQGRCFNDTHSQEQDSSISNVQCKGRGMNNAQGQRQGKRRGMKHGQSNEA